MSAEVRAALEDAMTTALNAHGDMLVKWTLCAEVIDQDGERGMWALAPEGQKRWDTLGLLAYGIQREQGATVREALGE